eukprot:4306460-Prymnesium_polylepis.1
MVALGCRREHNLLVHNFTLQVGPLVADWQQSLGNTPQGAAVCGTQKRSGEGCEGQRDNS